MTGQLIRLDTVDLRWTLYSCPYSSGYSSGYSQPPKNDGDGKGAVATLEQAKTSGTRRAPGRQSPSKRGVATARFPSPRPFPTAALPQAICLFSRNLAVHPG
jgi:hypothetical protein